MPNLIETWIRHTSPASELAAFFADHPDPWPHIPLECAPLTFGAGSTRSFADYFRGTSRVQAATLADVCEWLRGCSCLSDQELFIQEDFWQHPLTFEQLRKGDCEDHALWAWRKLGEIQIPARFAAGRWKGVAHAWVLIDHPDGTHLLETTAKDELMLRPLDPWTREQYCPALSVDHRFRTFVHAGYPRFIAPPVLAPRPPWEP